MYNVYSKLWNTLAVILIKYIAFIIWSSKEPVEQTARSWSYVRLSSICFNFEDIKIRLTNTFIYRNKLFNIYCYCHHICNCIDIVLRNFINIRKIHTKHEEINPLLHISGFLPFRIYIEILCVHALCTNICRNLDF